jgi:transcription antitermination factor NusG
MIGERRDDRDDVSNANGASMSPTGRRRGAELKANGGSILITTAEEHRLLSVIAGRTPRVREAAPVPTGPQSWYVARAMAGTEMTVADSIREIGMEVYVPIAKDWKTLRRSKVKTVDERPLYSGYLFVRAARDTWQIVLTVDGVGGLLTFEAGADQRVPLRVPDETINVIKTNEDMGMFDLTQISEASAFLAGVPVCVVAGPLEGYSGIVHRNAEKKKAWVIMSGPSPKPVEVPIDLLRLLA